MGSANVKRLRRRGPGIPEIDRVMSRLMAAYEIDRFRETQGPDPFRILVGCVISLRTKDEVTYPATERLFNRVRHPAQMARLSEATIAKLIYPAGFYRNKSRQIREFSKILVKEHGGEVPNTIDALLELPGVGRKTANLVVTLGFGKPGICVDIHVHRIANRLGWVESTEPDRTEEALRRFLPDRYWIPINETLVRHGQSVCRPTSPFCSACDVRSDCARRDVTRSR